MRSARGGANPSLDIELRSALGFEEGGLQIHQVHAVRPAARGPSGVPLRPDWERTALLQQAAALYVMAAATACIQSRLTDDHQCASNQGGR
jgi:hypothetical protein